MLHSQMECPSNLWRAHLHTTIGGVLRMRRVRPFRGTPPRVTFSGTIGAPPLAIPAPPWVSAGQAQRVLAALLGISCIQESEARSRGHLFDELLEREPYQWFERACLTVLHHEPAGARRAAGGNLLRFRPARTRTRHGHAPARRGTRGVQ